VAAFGESIGSMDHDPFNPLRVPRARHRYVHDLARPVDEALELRGGLMTGDRARAGAQHRRPHLGRPVERAGKGRIDARKHALPDLPGQPMLDLGSGEATRQRLGPREHTVLSVEHLIQHSTHRWRATTRPLPPLNRLWISTRPFSPARTGLNGLDHG